MNSQRANRDALNGASYAGAGNTAPVTFDIGGIQPLIVELKVCHHWGWASDFIPAIFIPVKNHTPIIAD